MQEPEKSLFMLALLGAMIGLGKLLASDERLTVRLAIGRTVMGAATSMVAGMALIQFPGLDPVALVGMGSMLGIGGSQALEGYFKRRLRQSEGRHGNGA
ncbi:holin [Cupriavidus sp. SK-3]|uniref:phage holin family protein n=1 Tax=Cupriavidus sp. SK-3 TaxID=1470558 RepID=UPI0004490F2A|nr:phage holin family protein [Cupriavidus sp. SK-3]KDP84722.1 holin [Cupriavidus sp. SK-3]